MTSTQHASPSPINLGAPLPPSTYEMSETRASSTTHVVLDQRPTPSPSPLTSSSSQPTYVQDPNYPQPSHPSQPITPKPADHTEPTSHPTQHTKTQNQSIPPRLLSTHLLKHPDDPVGKAIKTIFPHENPILRFAKRFKVKHSVIAGLTKKEMDRWEGEGKELRRKAGWKFEGEAGEGVVVGELFWKMYISLLPTLQRDPLSGLVPPDLLGSTSTMPLSIISLIPDIMQHYRDVIVRAQTEVFLATNYWQPSNSVNTISQALRDLSTRVIKEGRPKVIVKIMYDRGSWEQLWNAHAPVKPVEWSPLDLPEEKDIPGLDMEVVNFHRVLLGTFHAKFLIVDRKVALINSNNIQDRPNLELMSHLEGPVVDAFYEIALHSWYNRLSPPLPCLSKPYTPPIDPKSNQPRYLFQDQNPYFDDIETLKAARAARLLLRQQNNELMGEEGPHRFRDAVRLVVDRQKQTYAEWKPGEELENRARDAMKELRDFRERWGLVGMGGMGMGSRAGSRSNSRGPSRRGSTTDVVPRGATYMDQETAEHTAHNAAMAPSIATSSPTVVGDYPIKAKTYPQPSQPFDNSAFHDSDQEEDHPSPRPHVMFIDTAGLDGTGKQLGEQTATSPISATQRHRLLQEDRITASPETSDLQLPVTPTAAHDSVNARPIGPVDGLPISAQTTDEISRNMGQSEAVTEKPKVTRQDSELPPEGTGSKRMFNLSKRFNAAGVLSEAWATVEDSDELDNFRPHVVHKPHDPFPIAMCCRKPHGFPGHHDIRNPQNAAWLAGFRYAKKKVFIQTPTLNARPIVRGIKQACRRGVDVVLLLDLGFNDKGESIPFQGGTNEEVVERLYKILRKDKKEQFLKVYWYTGKDQVRPLNAVKKQRNCHIKFAAYDDEVLIIGNGNQDSQSWFHSQEVNVMVDSKQIISELMETLITNQNTMQYGLVDTDGIWRDGEGKTLEDYGATSKGAFRGLSAFLMYAKQI